MDLPFHFLGSGIPSDILTKGAELAREISGKSVDLASAQQAESYPNLVKKEGQPSNNLGLTSDNLNKINAVLKSRGVL